VGAAEIGAAAVRALVHATLPVQPATGCDRRAEVGEILAALRIMTGFLPQATTQLAAMLVGPDGEMELGEARFRRADSVAAAGRWLAAASYCAEALEHMFANAGESLAGSGDLGR
jgi:hypothetical protein